MRPRTGLQRGGDRAQLAEDTPGDSRPHAAVALPPRDVAGRKKPSFSQKRVETIGAHLSPKREEALVTFLRAKADMFA